MVQNLYIFPLAILIVKDIRFTLAPLCDGGLDESAGNIIWVMCGYDVVKQVDSSTLQVVIWDRFPSAAPKHIKFQTMVRKVVKLAASSKRTKTSSDYKPHASRWLNAKPLLVSP